MTKFLLATKEGMTQIFDEAGVMYPVTVLLAGPQEVVQVKTSDADGYNALQVGYGDRKESRINKALKGHMKGKNFRGLRELRLENVPEKNVGDSWTIDVLAEGDFVEVSAISKGKGFQGVVKRHGFGGGRRSHGQKHSEREPGSIGAGGVQRVLKGLKMGGRMGGDRVTVKNLKVVKVDTATGRVYLQGAVPGRRGTLVEIRG